MNIYVIEHTQEDTGDGSYRTVHFSRGAARIHGNKLVRLYRKWMKDREAGFDVDELMEDPCPSLTTYEVGKLDKATIGDLMTRLTSGCCETRKPSSLRFIKIEQNIWDAR